MFVVDCLCIGACDERLRSRMEACGVSLQRVKEPRASGPLVVMACTGQEIAQELSRGDVSPERVVALCREPSGLPRGCLWLEPTVMEPFRTSNLLRAWLSGSEEDPVQGLLAQISHDMRSPLSVITTAASLIAKFGMDPSKTARYLELINESSGVLKSLVSDILDYSNIRQGEFSFTAADFHLPQLLASVTESFRLLVRDPDRLTVSCLLDPELPEFVSGDPGRLRQVLTNLMNNAVKFTSAGKVTLGATVTSGELRFYVQDTGIGIAAEALERIFLPYQQADRNVHSCFGGTGLGLTICSALVRRMGGQIGVESRVGEGSLFWFTAVLPEVVSKSLKDLPRLAGRQVLLASASANLTPAWLDKICPVRVAATREEAQKLFSDQSFDICLVDLELGGWDFVRELVAREGQHAVVVATSVGQRGDVSLCKEHGVAGYLTAPFQKEELETALALVLEPLRQDIVTKYSAKEFLNAQSGS